MRRFVAVCGFARGRRIVFRMYPDNSVCLQIGTRTHKHYHTHTPTHTNTNTHTHQHTHTLKHTLTHPCTHAPTENLSWLNQTAAAVLNCGSTLLFASPENVITHLRSWKASQGVGEETKLQNTSLRVTKAFYLSNLHPHV